MNEFTAKAAFGVVLTGCLTLLGGWDRLLMALVILIVLDYTSGLLAAVISGGGISSAVGIRGIAKKLFLLLLVALAATLDGVFNTGGPWLRTAAITLMIGNEGFSILENADRARIPYPVIIKRLLQQVRDKERGAPV